ncbi:MAG: hypothetical protein ACRDSZ_13700 [Pseudonocardiaceae bacterium]
MNYGQAPARLRGRRDDAALALRRAEGSLRTTCILHHHPGGRGLGALVAKQPASFSPTVRAPTPETDISSTALFPSPKPSTANPYSWAPVLVLADLVNRKGEGKDGEFSKK